MNQLEIEYERKWLQMLQQASDMIYECIDSGILQEHVLDNDLEDIHSKLLDISSIHFDKLKAEELKIYIANKYPTFPVDKLK